MIGPARQAAVEALGAVESGRVDLPTALAQAHAGLADARDRGLLTELATGVVRWRLALDFGIHALTGRQPGELDPDVRTALRLGLYQLQHATRLPVSAVVNDAVEIVKRGRTRSAAGLVNAVLRRVAREGPPRLPEAPRVSVDDPAWRGQAVAYLSITHSHPRWLVERWLDRIGFDAAEAWVTYDNLPAEVTIWPLTRPAARDGRDADAPAWLGRGDREIPAGRPTRHVPGGWTLEHGRDALPAITAGAAYAQDEASAAVAVVAGSVGRGRVLDACAAPGGKSIAMRPWLPADARLMAADLRPRRVALLAATLARVPGPPIAMLRCDAQRLPFTNTIDTLLVDAPCSGLGTLRRDPDVRWRRTPADLAALAGTQRALVDEGLRALSPRGRLIYATCSGEPEENEALVAQVIETRPDLRLVDLRRVPLPESMGALITPEGMLRSWPHVHGLDAFFAAVIERRDA